MQPLCRHCFSEECFEKAYQVLQDSFFYISELVKVADMFPKWALQNPLVDDARDLSFVIWRPSEALWHPWWSQAARMNSKGLNEEPGSSEKRRFLRQDEDEGQQ